MPSWMNERGIIFYWREVNMSSVTHLQILPLYVWNILNGTSAKWNKILPRCSTSVHRVISSGSTLKIRDGKAISRGADLEETLMGLFCLARLPTSTLILKCVPCPISWFRVRGINSSFLTSFYLVILHRRWQCIPCSRAFFTHVYITLHTHL